MGEDFSSPKITIMENYKLIVYTDFHLKLDNLKSVKSLCSEAIRLANSFNIKTHIWLGDIFDSRISQKEDVLNCLTSIIEEYDKAEQEIICIPGNHDKTNYNNESSFLDSYKYHPSFNLITRLTHKTIEDLPCYFLPFFNDDILFDEIESRKDFKKDSLLFGHFAVTGSKNNDGSSIENSLKPSFFNEKFKKVYLGHYHNYQKVNDKIIHLGSLQQNNFGEDDKKGFWLIDEDGNHNLITAESGQSYKKLEIDLSQTPIKQVNKIIEVFKSNNPSSKLRVELIGNTSELKSFDKEKFTEIGIDFKKKYIEVENNISENSTLEVESLSTNKIIEKFDTFCKEKEYNYNDGITILKKAICQ